MVRRIIFSCIFIFGIAQILFSQITWLENSPVGTGTYNAIASADFNYDGLIDIAAAPASGGIQIWYRTSSGWNPTPENLPTSNVFRSLAAGDIDFDGFADIAGSGNYVLEAWLHKFNSEPGTFTWVNANTFNPAPSGLFNTVLLANVNRIEEKYDCVMYTPGECQTSTPKGLDIVLTENTGSGNGLRVYKWAGMIGSIPNCEGSWEQEYIMGLPNGGYYNQVVAADINLDSNPDLVAVRDGGMEVLMRTYMSPGGCYMPDKGAWFNPWWMVENGVIPYSDVLPYQGSYKSVVVTDVNKDLYPDIVAIGSPVEDQINSGIEVWYGKSPFYEPGAFNWLWTKEIDAYNHFKHLLIAGTFTFIGQGDFNGDYLPDIAVVATTPPTSIWKGHLFVQDTINFVPQRFFWESETAPASAGAFRKLITADFDRDGKEDIAFPSNNSGGIRVYRRTSADVNFPTQWYPQDIYTQGGPLGEDILASVRFAGTGIIAGGGSGDTAEQGLTFGQPNPLAAYVALAEDDITSSTPDSIKVFSTRGEGDWSSVPFPALYGRFQAVKLGNINNDAFLDLAASKITGTAQTDCLHVWFSNQSGGWDERSFGINCSGKYYDFSLADTNGDQFADIVAAKTIESGGSGSIEIWEGTPGDVTMGWQWSLAHTLQVQNEPYRSITTGDFNEDGLMDIIGCTTSPDRKIIAWYQTLTGWTSQIIANLSADCWKIFATHINQDKWLDIVATTGNGIVIYRQQLLTGGLVWVAFATPASSGLFAGAVTADLNADGCTDIVAQSDSPALTRTWYQNRSTSGCLGEWSEQPQADPNYSCSDMASGDLSIDHLPDIVSTCDDSSGLHVLRANYNYTGESNPTLRTPSNGSTITTTRQPLFQLDSTSPYSKCLRYQIQIDGTTPYNFTPPDDTFTGFITPNGWSPICNLTGAYANYAMQVTDVFPSGLPDKLYYWRGRAYDNFMLSSFSTAFTFTINTTDKTAPGATFPIYLTKQTNGVRLFWQRNNESDVDRYRIFRGTTANFTPLPSNMIGQIQCSTLPCPTPLTFDDTSFLGNNILYYYKVKAIDQTGNQGP